jgi:nucleotide-binding universal stress UspA family protein
MPKQKVLVPLDGSKASLQILPHVRKLLRPEGTELILLRVGDEPSGWVDEPEEPAAIDFNGSMYPSPVGVQRSHHQIYASQEEESCRATMEDELQDELGELATDGYSVSLEVSFGEAADEIVSLANLKEVDLVAMTTHSRTGLGRLFVGSVAEDVVRAVPAPVLLFHPRSQS